VEEASGSAPEIWPDNVQTVNLFLAVATQWRIGPHGHTGLDYNVLYKKMDRMHLSEERYDELEAEIQIMEDAALDEIQSQ
jgi:hypothetical protein